MPDPRETVMQAEPGLIVSRDNPRLKRARRLHGRRARASSGLFIAEGEDLLAAALAAGIAPVEVLAVPEVDLPVACERVAPAALGDVGTLGHPARVIALFRRVDLPVAGAADLALELHDVHDPGNVGTLVRAAAALGPAVVVLGAGCADPLGPRAVRASMGAIFVVPVLAATPPGHRIGLAADGQAVLAEVDLRGPVVFVLGGERTGLPEDAGCDVVCRIPQTGAIDSLNVAMAGTIALYEARRQRHHAAHA